MTSLKLCGPKLSTGCALLSIWGVVQLAVMSLFFHIKSVALIEDLPLNHTLTNYTEIVQVSKISYFLETKHTMLFYIKLSV